MYIFRVATKASEMDVLNDIIEFKSSPAIRAKIMAYATSKVFSEGETILRESAYVKAIPIVTRGNIKVIRTDEDGQIGRASWRERV